METTHGFWQVPLLPVIISIAQMETVTLEEPGKGPETKKTGTGKGPGKGTVCVYNIYIYIREPAG